MPSELLPEPIELLGPSAYGVDWAAFKAHCDKDTGFCVHGYGERSRLSPKSGITKSDFLAAASSWKASVDDTSQGGTISVQTSGESNSDDKLAFESSHYNATVWELFVLRQNLTSTQAQGPGSMIQSGGSSKLKRWDFDLIRYHVDSGSF